MSITLASMVGLALAVCVLAAPGVFSVEPQAISTAGGPATLLGFELSADCAVRANGALAPRVDSVTANQLAVELPPGAPGLATLTLEQRGRTVATLERAFRYVPAPELAARDVAAAAARARVELAREAGDRRERATARVAARSLRAPVLADARAATRAAVWAYGEAWLRAAAARQEAAAADAEAQRQAAADQAAREAGCVRAGYDDWQATAMAPDGRYFVTWSVPVSNGCDRPFRVQVTLSLYDRDRREIRRYVETLVVPARQTVSARGTALEGGLILRTVARREANLVRLD